MKRLHKRIDKLLRPYGLFLRRSSGNGHYHIVNADGKYLATMSTTPKNETHAARNTVSLLVRQGHLPQSMKRAI